MKKVLILGIIFWVMSLQTVFAGQIGQNEGGFYYVQDDGTLAISKWVKIDLNGDGIEEDCYFNEMGFLDLNAKQNQGTPTLKSKTANEQERSLSTAECS